MGEISVLEKLKAFTYKNPIVCLSCQATREAEEYACPYCGEVSATTINRVEFNNRILYLIEAMRN